MKIRIILSFLILLVSCGTTQTYLPLTPLKKAETEVKFGIGLPLNKFSNISFSVGWNFGVSDRDVIGLTMTNFILPTHVAYSHYFNNRNQKYISNAEFHLGNILGAEYNPDYELKFGMAQKFESGRFQRLSAGIAMYGNAFLGNNTYIKIMPKFTYNLRINDAQFEANYDWGQTKFYLSKYCKNESVSNVTTIKYSDIDSFIILNNTIDIDSVPMIKISLKDSSYIAIYKKPEYKIVGDLIKPVLKLDIYNSDSDLEYISVFISKEQRNYTLFYNFEKIISDYKAEKDIIISDIQDLFEKEYRNIGVFDDLNFGIGTRTIQD